MAGSNPTRGSCNFPTPAVLRWEMHSWDRFVKLNGQLLAKQFQLEALFKQYGDYWPFGVWLPDNEKFPLDHLPHAALDLPGISADCADYHAAFLLSLLSSLPDTAVMLYIEEHEESGYRAVAVSSRSGLVCREYAVQWEKTDVEEMLSLCRRKVCKRSKWLASCTKLGEASCTPIQDLLECHDRIVCIPMGRLQGLAFSALWWRSAPLLHQRRCTWAASLTIMAFQRPEVAVPITTPERRFGLVIGAPKGAKSFKGPHSSFREKAENQELQQRQRCRSAGRDRRRAHGIASSYLHTPSPTEEAQQLLRCSSVPAD